MSSSSDSVDSILKNLPIANVTLSIVAGFCSGYAAKAVGRALAVVVGVGFVALQLLQHKGYITINWGKAEKELVDSVDQNGDGKLDKDDLLIAKNRVMPILTKGLPSAAGFGTGLFLAFKFA